MDGDGGGLEGGGMGGMNSGGIRDVNGDIEARMENTDGDSGVAALQSMGYIDGGAEMGQGDGDSTSSWHSTLNSVIVIAMAALLGGYLLYSLLSGILAMFGVQL
ncbi:hypothetical protein HUG10_03450 [Halorarum halophilum]|uniref:Uncharacterized protein n=1 Tax=Halorarum halophilum TaxID=2743090 RepID=A0A7D5GY81_9EURY|nr:hypothetical protein [Halobaculum halophilum]QLG26653.1 hypothetical protein HUG10_03450 [Halobaculum halophilum]